MSSHQNHPPNGVESTQNIDQIDNSSRIQLLLSDDPSETLLTDELFICLGFQSGFAKVFESMQIKTIQDFLIFIHTHSYESALGLFCEKLRLLRVPTSDPKEVLESLKSMISALILNDRIVNISKLPTEDIISIGDSVLDKAIGGFMTSKVIEIVGTPGSGKSTLSLQLCVQVCCPTEMGGLNGKALYINTDGKFSIDRLRQMIEAKLDNIDTLRKSVKATTIPSMDLSQFEERIIVQDGVPSIEEFDYTLKDIDKYCSLNSDIRLVVIDTIGSIYRSCDSTMNSMISRAKLLCNSMRRLKKIAENYNVCVITVNQVSAVIDDLNPFSGLIGEKKVQAALGLVWSNSLNARILLEVKENSRLSTATSFSKVVKRRRLNNNEIYYIDHEESMSHRETKQRREIGIEFSSYHTVKPQKCNFVIHNRGLIGLVVNP